MSERVSRRGGARCGPRLPARTSIRLGPGDDFLLGGRRFAIKARAGGVDAFYWWLGDRFGIVVATDREDPLVVLRLGDFLRELRFRNHDSR